MESIWDSIFTMQGLALLITAVLFVVSIFLVLRSLIGFVITSIMLFVAVVSGFLIFNNAITRKIFHYDTHALPENQVISPSSVKQAVMDVYELARSGVCTETIKVVYDPQTGDRLDATIIRLQQQQDQLQAMLKSLHSPQPKVTETMENR